MIVIMKPNATAEQVEVVVKRIKKEGLDVQVNQGKEQIVIGLKGDTRLIQDVAFQLRWCRRRNSYFQYVQIDFAGISSAGHGS